MPGNHKTLQTTIYERIVEVFQARNVPMQLKDIALVDERHLPFVVVWWAKEFGIHKEEVGEEIFGDKWEDDKWI